VWSLEGSDVDSLPSCRQATVFGVGLSQATALGAERAEHGWPGKLSNVLEGSGRFQNSRENSRSFEKAGKPIYTVVWVGGLSVG